MLNHDLLKKLAPILEKNPIVETAKAKDILESAAHQDEFYRRACIAYQPLHDEEELEKKIMTRLGRDRAAVGAVVAPYGYGKTSFMAYLWQQFENQNFAVVPPFCFSSFQDIVHTVYGWARYKLEGRMPDQIGEITDAYKHTMAVSLEEQAKLLSEDGHSQKQHLQTLQQLYIKGKWEPEVTVLEVVRFLKVCVDNLVKAKFKGLIILADEMQQFISQPSMEFRTRLGELFDLVTHVETRTFPICLIMGMLSGSEASIQSIRGDLIDRLKQDNLYVDLQNLYDEYTPMNVWIGMLGNIGAREYEDMVIDKYALRGCGQIAFDPDLGNGPRTMVRVFQQAIRKYDATAKSYTAIDLVDDYLNNEIQYDGTQARLRNAVSRSLEVDFIHNNKLNESAVKLMGAFPRGLNEDIQLHYGVSDTMREISKRVHGTLIEWSVEGFTLKELRKGERQGTLDRIISIFWRDYTEDFERLESAQVTFNKHIIPKLFEVRRGSTLDKWSSYKLERLPMGKSIYKSEMSGSLNPKYPERTMTIYTSAGVPENAEIVGRTQFVFRFELILDKDMNSFEPGELKIENNNSAIFSLHMLRRVSSGELPPSLLKLQDFMQPKDVNPLLMLSLVDWIENWDNNFPEQRIPEQDRPEIFDHMIPLLIDYCIRTLFSSELLQTSGSAYRNVGTQLVGEVLSDLCEKRWPSYSTMYVTANYEDLLKRYQNVLGSEELSLKEKRGNKPIQIEKEKLCDLFGWPSIASLENRLKGDYNRLSLVKVHNWSGNLAEVTLSQHPLEEKLARRLHESLDTRVIDGNEVQVISGREALDDAIANGYSEEEFAWAIQLLGNRALIGSDPEEGLLVLIKGGLSVEQVRDSFSEQDEKRLALSKITLSRTDQEEARNVERSFEALKAKLYQPEIEDNEEELNEINFFVARRLPEQLTILQAHISTSLINAVGKIIGETQQREIEYEHLLRDLHDRKMAGLLTFVDFLENIRIALQGDVSSELDLCKDIEQKATGLKSIDERTQVNELGRINRESDKLNKQLGEMSGKMKLTKDRINQHKEWRAILTMGSELYTVLQEYRMNDLAKGLSEISENIRRSFTEDNWKTLSNHEVWKTKMDEIRSLQISRVDQGQEEFNNLKESYHRLMSYLGVKDYICRSEFHFNNPKKSQDNLHNEVFAKVNNRIEFVYLDIKDLDDTIIRAQHLQEKGANEISILNDIILENDKIKKEFDDLKSTSSVEMIANISKLEGFVENLNNVTKKIANLTNKLFKYVLVRVSAEGEEIPVLNQLKREPQDLARVAVPLINQYEMNTQRLFDLLEKLYSKNLIKIEISQID